MTKRKKDSSTPAQVAETTIPAGPPPASAAKALTFRPAYPALDAVKAPRAGSKRARILEKMLNGGLTIEQVQNDCDTGWDRRTAMEGIRLLHKALGYGLRTDENGVIHAYGPEAKSAAGAA